MAARRLILALLVMLVLSSVLVALVPVERDRLRSSTTTTTTTEPAPDPTGRLVRRTIAADDPTPSRIDLAPGDQLELTVTAAKLPDQVEIAGFGAFADVDPDFPAHFDLLAVETGRFPVRLVEAERVIATIRVRAAQSSSDSPGNKARSSTDGARSDNSASKRRTGSDRN